QQVRHYAFCRAHFQQSVSRQITLGDLERILNGREIRSRRIQRHFGDTLEVGSFVMRHVGSPFCPDRSPSAPATMVLSMNSSIGPLRKKAKAIRRPWKATAGTGCTVIFAL